ncbi:hypothetical protein CspeluHIS016_0203460 [Cutaneotrichosporon spelunceum]|uniref:MICOS complex subunit MIC12 n=1 Tax=Cutaneotrichosporon spelunceum TaxID=1672016 RepID=A0AAD3TR37_9TREE|nr:hypothetical protein CspeluHIS016_0203460 [Cutaneotrichosporon spelunceum]
MAGFLLGAGSGVLAGAAVYYTISTTNAQSVSQIRQDLHTSATLLESSFDTTPHPAPSSLVGPRAGPPRFTETLKQRWNAALGGAYAHATETNWIALGEEAVDGVRGQLARLSETEPEEEPAMAAVAVDSVPPEVISDVVDVVENKDAPRERGDVHVDRGIKASERGITSPKRLV